MSQLFLTSSVHAVAYDIAKRLDLSKSNKLVFIDTPAEPEKEDLGWLHDDRKALVNAGFDVTDYTITGKTKEQLINDLSDFDFIYMSGGNTFYLLEQSQKSEFIEVVRDFVLNKGKTYIGTSAGSIIAGAKCPDYLLEYHETDELEGKDGYGLVNFTILPHWGSEDFKELYLGKRLDIAYRDDQIPLIALTDNHYIHVVDGKMEIIEV